MMIPTSLAVATGISNVFVGEDTYMQDDPGADLGSFLALLDRVELETLAEALLGVVPILGLDLPRLRSLADGAVQLDLSEAVPALIMQASKYADVHILEDLAALSSDPSLSSEHQANISDMCEAGHIRAQLRHYLKIRLGLALPSADLEHVLAMQTWPGRYSEVNLRRVAPVVYVAEEEAPITDMWQVIAAFSRAGARIKRLPKGFSKTVKADWLSDLYPIVFWSANSLAEWTQAKGKPAVRSVHVGSAASHHLGMPRLVNRTGALLPRGMSLLQVGFEASTIGSPLHVDSLTAGAFDSAEMSYLGGAAKGTVQRLSKEGLYPRNTESHRWSFDQLITLRLIQSVRARGRVFREGPKALLERIADLAIATKSHEVGIDVRGRLFVRDEDVFRDLETGQSTFDIVVTVDQAFQSFQFGAGTVPNLLNPSPRVAVHPQVLGGTPAVREKRVPARAVEQIWRERGEDVLRSAYPELTAAEVSDARRVGAGIRKYRVSQ
jgi:uncharacterized protein (DUF433 family)